ncbi:MAG TPA: HDOD domain-containing protein [Tepidisphaeraceae bacterium]|jgi:HD-like signal output (HDOD) protein
MKTILVVDDMAIFRDPIAASLRLAGYQTITAADGEEALRITRSQRPDLVLLDASMPKMDGLTFLRHLRADPSVAATRVILLTALSESKYVLAAASFGVRDYLLKSRFRLADLMDRIEKMPPTAVAGAAEKGAAPNVADATHGTPVIATGPTPAVAPAGTHAAQAGPPTTPKLPNAPADGSGTLLTREAFLRRVGEAFHAKTLSGVVAQVIAMASSPLGDMSQLAALIARDAMLSVRVIQAANSAAYGSRGPAVTNIPDAIRKLGFATIRNIAASLGVFDCMPEVGSDGFDPIRYWQHSFAVAHLCESLAMKSPAQAGLAYVIGLCHDLGEILVRTIFTKEYEQVLDAAERTGRPLEQLHREMLGMSYQEMVRELLGRMGLPLEIREPILQFHAADPVRSDNKLTQLLWLADNYANAAMLASSTTAEIAPVSTAFYQSVVGTAELNMPDPQALRTQILSLTVTLAGLSKADAMKLMVPMFDAGQARLWVVRPPTVAKFDPITLALEALASVTVSAAFPKPDELEKVDGLVLLIATSHSAAPLTKQAQAALEARQNVPAKALSLLQISCQAQDQRREDPLPDWKPSVTLAELAKIADVKNVNPEQRAAA